MDEGGVPAWAAMGLCGRFQLVIPERDVVAVSNPWNIFGPARSTRLAER